MARAYLRKRVWWVDYADHQGKRTRKPSSARRKAAAVRLAQELEAKAERQRLGLEPLPVEDGGGPWTILVERYGERYAAVAPWYRRWQSLARRHLLVPPLA